ncbi:MAG: ribonuclease HII [Rhizobiales bacterium]|nr:ribonuclease HII [Hyphomicrobiales bacterium]
MGKADSNLPDFSFEEAQFAGGAKIVAGVDEVGRGPWAGPVVAAAVILDPARIPDGLNDSKKLSPKRRDQIFEEITRAAAFSVALISPAEIDQLNILRASLKAMANAIAGLPKTPDAILVDGNQIPPTNIVCQTIVGGDGRSLSIAAASIVAKVTRDRIMQKLALEYPGFGWETNMGYGTKAHQIGLAKHGVTPHHRRSFRPIKAALENR